RVPLHGQLSQGGRARPDAARAVTARRDQAAARLSSWLVLRLPQPRGPRPAAAGQRAAGAVLRVVPALRPVPRRQVPRLAGGRARPPHRQLEWQEGISALHPLSQPALAAIQAAPAAAPAAAPRRDRHRTLTPWTPHPT